jgi:iron complex transport system substrate-binding protein
VRVVSLLPAATEIVAALGAGDWLVGVSHECDYPPAVQALPRVTRSTLDPSLSSGEIDRQMAAAQAAGTSPIAIDTDVLRRLAPDVILGQSVCDVCAVGESALAAALAQLGARPRVVTLHAHDLVGVLADIQRVGAALDLADEAEELVLGMRYRFHTVSNRAPRTTHRVLVLEWLDPPYVAGHWVPELVAIAGGTDVGNRPGARSVARPWSELRALAPERVVIALCGFDVARARREAASVTDADGRALLHDDGGFIDGNAYTSRPGPRLADAAELLAPLMAG